MFIILATGHFDRNGWSELPERSLQSRRTLTEVLFVPHFIQDVTALASSALSASHSTQTSPEPTEGVLPFAIFKNCPVTSSLSINFVHPTHQIFSEFVWSLDFRDTVLPLTIQTKFVCGQLKMAHRNPHIYPLQISHCGQSHQGTFPVAWCSLQVKMPGAPLSHQSPGLPVGRRGTQSHHLQQTQQMI